MNRKSKTIVSMHQPKVHSTLLQFKQLASNALYFMANLYSHKDCLLCNLTDPYEETEDMHKDAILIHYNFEKKKLTTIKIKWENIQSLNLTSILLLATDIYAVATQIDIDCCDRSRQEDHYIYKASLHDSTLTIIKDLRKEGISFRGFGKYQSRYLCLLCGERMDNKDYSDKCLKYDIANNRWLNMPKASEPKASVGTFECGQFIYMVGGYTNKKLVNTVEKIPINGKAWIQVRITSSKFTAFRCDINPIYTNNSHILVYGRADDMNQHAYKINVKSWECHPINTLKEGNIYSAIVKGHIIFVENGKFNKYDLEGKLVETVNIEEHTKKWNHASVEPSLKESFSI